MRDLVDLHDDLVKMAGEIAKIEPFPEKWDTPVIFLVESLEIEAMERKGGEKGYAAMVEKVRDALSDWLAEKRW